MEKNIKWQKYQIDRAAWERRNNHSAAFVWLTGLSGAGKTTIADELGFKLFNEGIHACVLDGDNVRHGLNSDLGFNEKDRHENIRRVGEAGLLLANYGMLTISAFISPYIKGRNRIRERCKEEGIVFIEVFIDCPLSVCEERDTKGLYKKARNGEIKNFTGIDDPYEKPINSELSIRTDKMNLQECVDKVYNYLKERKII